MPWAREIFPGFRGGQIKESCIGESHGRDRRGDGDDEFQDIVTQRTTSLNPQGSVMPLCVPARNIPYIAYFRIARRQERCRGKNGNKHIPPPSYKLEALLLYCYE